MPNTRGTKPEWMNLPRRKCENCGTTYKPTRPKSRFHSDDCRKSYHKHGGAYAKLKREVAKMVEKELVRLKAEHQAEFIQMRTELDGVCAKLEIVKA